MALLFGEHRELLMYGAGEKLVDADGVVFKSLAVLGRGTLHVCAERGENASVTDLQKSFVNRWVRSVCLARKWITNCKPVDRLAISHILRVKCIGGNMERSRDDE